MEANRTDFGSSITAVTFEASLSQSEATVTISLVDDAVNEAEEGFIIVIQVVEIGDIDEQSLILERNGVALVRIVDNDRKCYRFKFLLVIAWVVEISS